MDAEPRRAPLWKNPFAVAFVVGILALTALPFLQRRFLRAPPPLRPLGGWALLDAAGQRVGSTSLAGRVWIFQALPAGCLPGCAPRVEAQAALWRHLEDLAGKVGLVTVVVPTEGAEVYAPELVQRAGPHWHVLSGSAAEVDLLVARGLLPALQGWGSADAGADSHSFSSLPSFALVDQNGDVRGFWSQDELGRGNLINAARLLARHGPSP